MRIRGLIRRVDAAYGPLMDVYRGAVPRQVLSVLIATESGGDRFCVAQDYHLIEVGLSQEPLVRVHRADVDPFDDLAGVWLRCTTSNEHLERLRQRTRLALGHPRDVGYAVLLGFAVGTGAAAHILSCIAVAPSLIGRSANEASSWAKTSDLSRPAHASYWGRQKPELIAKRIRLAAVRLRWAEELGELGAATAPAARPHMPSFPDELQWAAQVTMDKKSTKIMRQEAHRQTIRYRDRRRTEARMKRPSLLAALARWLYRTGTRTAEDVY